MERQTPNETTIPDIERCAITLLIQHRGRAYHPVLRAYINTIVREPGEQRLLNQFPVPNEITATPDEDRWFRLPQPDVYGRDSLSGMIYDHDAFNRDIDGGFGAPYRFLAMWDDAILRLAHAVIDFRRAGREAGDQMHDIHGLGGPLAITTTSLAAAVVEFVHAAEGCWAYEVENREEFS